jgi:hypothetical protein
MSIMIFYNKKWVIISINYGYLISKSRRGRKKRENEKKARVPE